MIQVCQGITFTVSTGHSILTCTKGTRNPRKGLTSCFFWNNIMSEYAFETEKSNVKFKNRTLLSTLT